MPVFSGSRVSGFNYILVPSPRDFVAAKMQAVASNRTRDVNSWTEKTDGVFWRGEGGHMGGSDWSGSVGARLVNLAKGGSASRGRDGPTVHVSFMDGSISRCEAAECQDTVPTFGGSNKPTPGPAKASSSLHLIDIDQVGQFLPFLRSNSTVYRATMFQRWYDERVHPWKHYVPLDVSLSGLWDVVRLVSRKFLVQFSDSSKPLAEQIAIDGQDWAAKAVRKEDMQVYMFRLLLEWGRLVDDDREELGCDP